MTFRPRLVPCPNGCTTVFGEENRGVRVEYATNPDCTLCGGRGEVIEIERDGKLWKRCAVNLQPKGE
jgi:hypothetical protein